jgi:hypothetical protein
LLLDTLDWTPDAPFEADGTLTLANWRAENASIATTNSASALRSNPKAAGASICVAPRASPAHSAMAKCATSSPTLDLGVQWGNGWRVTPNSGCLPIRLGGIDAAGLSFANGEFLAVPTQRRADRGRCVAQHVRRLFHPQPRPQRPHVWPRRPAGALERRNVSRPLPRPHRRLHARNRSRCAPPLHRDDGGAHASVSLQRLTADAHIAESWSVAGSFDAGALTDPAARLGLSHRRRVDGSSRRTASRHPRDAGEALLTANRPATEEDRPLFNPLRIVEANALLQERRNHRIWQRFCLDDRSRQLARFNARHDVSEGRGQRHRER